MNRNCTKTSDLSRERLLIKHTQSGCYQSRNALMVLSMDAVSAFVFRTYPTFTDFHSDLNQECLSAIPVIIEAYDLTHPARVRFMTFAYKHLKKAATRYLRQAVPIAELNGLDCLPEPKDRNSSDGPEHTLEQQLVSNLVKPALDTLDQRSRDIITQRAMSDSPIPLSVLAHRYDISAPRVHAIESKAFSHLTKILSKLNPVSVS